MDENGEMLEMKGRQTEDGTLPPSYTDTMLVMNEKDGDVIDKNEEEEERETWGTKADFLLSIIGFAVDLANVWRFPYLCYRNGGGAFLIPYFLMLLFGGLPLLYMELLLGQFHKSGPITIWKLSPIFKGIGYCSVLISYWVAFYYNVVIGWSFYYLFASFTSTLPWTTCDNEWNTANCSNNVIVGNTSTAMMMRSADSVSSTDEYYRRNVLGIHHSSGMGDYGAIRWPLALCNLLAFTTLFFVLFKGIKTGGKVVWVTALLPYVVLSILLVRGFMLPGFQEGIRYYITPNMDRLAKSEVWIDAAVQIMYSVGPGFGVHISYASYNKFQNNVYRDALCTCLVNSFTSFFSGFVIFSYLGYMAQRQGVPIENVAAQGPGLVFIVYPEAIATLPGSVFWSILFFLMLLTLGMDSAMGGMEAILTGLGDAFPRLKKGKYTRQLFSLAIISVAYLVSLTFVTEGGAYLVNLFDTYAAGISLLVAVLFESITVSWFYGIDQFCRDAHAMMGFEPGIYWRLCWKFFTPIFIIAIVFSAIIGAKVPTFGEYVYPTWAMALGWTIASSSMTLIPLYAVYKWCTTHGPTKQKLALLISPEWEHETIRSTGYVKRFTLRHWLSLGDSKHWFRPGCASDLDHVVS